ncbi:MAG: hypothetical protein KAH84_04755, partial [Thiomargarita sp.]|nr:hypothetical protein [Thiomargarita sp.]
MSNNTSFAIKFSKIIVIFLVLGTLFYQFLYPIMFEAYTGVVNSKLTYSNSQKLSDAEFEAIACELTYQSRYEKAGGLVTDPNYKLKMDALKNTTPSCLRQSEFKHIKYFRDADIRQYKGPETCLQCHETFKVYHADGTNTTVETLNDIVDSVHFKFQSSSSGFSTYGYDGRQVNSGEGHSIPVGKINRACGIPGSFSWTGWAELIKTSPAHTSEIEIRSEGCGQCHIGGNYHPATEKMMPIGDVPAETKQGIDCLICHADQYDMNQRYVIKDENGQRWNQDRSMKAAISITRPTSKTCLNCHQHNMGGDTYIHNVAAKSLGYENKRLLHNGAKRGNPFSPTDDVHAAAGLNCIDCHVPEGHKIPRGRLGVDLVANDLPDKTVSCESCHTVTPHTKSNNQTILNGHIAKLACETCHITKLQDTSVVLRDWVHPTWNEEEGIYTPTDIYLSGEVGKGFIFLWLNGNGTFLANALGNNPNHSDQYNPLMQQMTILDNPEVIAEVRAKAIELKKIYPDIDVEKYVEAATKFLTPLSPEMLEKRQQMIQDNLRPVMNQGKSRIYPFKLFNAIMYEDMGNQGPFGAMILPFDYPSYYETGDTIESVKIALKNPIVKRMYETPFKLYMMDEFMSYFGILEGWKTNYPLVDDKLVNVEAHWMRQMGTLMVNHGIEKTGRQCDECHTTNGIMDFSLLGYPPERVEELENVSEIEAHLKQ